MCCRETMGSTEVYKMVLNIIPCLFVFLYPISNIEKIFMYILVFRPFQNSSLMITSQTTCMDGQSSTGAGLKLQRPSTPMKAQYSPSASAVFPMRCSCLCTVYDANFDLFLTCTRIQNYTHGNWTLHCRIEPSS